MFQFAFEAVLFKFTYEAAQFAPLLQLPPTRAQNARKSTEGVRCIPEYLIFYCLHFIRGKKSPCPPRAAYAAEGCSQEREAPKAQSAFEAVWPKDTDEAAQHAPLLQEPPTRAIATIVKFIQ